MNLSVGGVLSTPCTLVVPSCCSRGARGKCRTFETFCGVEVVRKRRTRRFNIL